jgi:hypothetical protein
MWAVENREFVSVASACRDSGRRDYGPRAVVPRVCNLPVHVCPLVRDLGIDPHNSRRCLPVAILPKREERHEEATNSECDKHETNGIWNDGTCHVRHRFPAFYPFSAPRQFPPLSQSQPFVGPLAGRGMFDSYPLRHYFSVASPGQIGRCRGISALKSPRLGQTRRWLRSTSATTTVPHFSAFTIGLPS